MIMKPVVLCARGTWAMKKMLEDTLGAIRIT